MYNVLGNSSGFTIIKLAACAYLFCYILDFATKGAHHQDWVSFHYFIGSFFIVCISVLSLLNLIFSSVVITYRTNMLYWFSLGLMLYYFVDPVCGAFIYVKIPSSFVTITYMDYLNQIPAIEYLQYFVSDVLYLLLSIGFLYADFVVPRTIRYFVKLSY